MQKSTIDTAAASWLEQTGIELYNGKNVYNCLLIKLLMR